MDTNCPPGPRGIAEFLAQHCLGVDQRIIVCWSGGRDSTALLSLTAEWAQEHQVRVLAVVVPYPNVIVGRDRLEETRQAWAPRNVDVLFLDTTQPDPPPTPLVNACPDCKAVRRRILQEALSNRPDLSVSCVLTGHNAADLAAYATELFVSRLGGAEVRADGMFSVRALENLNKCLPVYRPPGGPIIARPFLALNDADIERLLAERPGRYPPPFIACRCPWLRQRKRILQEYFATHGLRFAPDRLRAVMGEQFGVPQDAAFAELPFVTYLL